MPSLFTKFKQYNSCYFYIVYVVPDPCLLEPCDVNAGCTREGLLSPDFTCTCREPFTDGDGFNCSG